MKPIIKVCGITRVQDAIVATMLGADLIGLNLFPKSPRSLTLAKAREIAEVICANGPLAIEAITRTLHETDGMELDAALRHEAEYGQRVFASEDAKEGPLAFAQKRKPVFQGR